MRGSIGFKLLHIVVALIVISGCRAIKIETGATEEATASSQSEARQIRTRWKQRLDRASPQEITLLLKDYIDTSAVRLVYVGLQFAQKWREGNAGRGEAIPGDEMRQIINNSTLRDRPVFQAWEDNIEYGWRIVKEKGDYSDFVLDEFKQLIDQYYKVYSAVMYPNGTVDEYERNMRDVHSELSSLSQYLSSDLR